MKTNQRLSGASVSNHYRLQLLAAFLVCIIAAQTAQSAPQRPIVPPGGNNRIAPVAAPRAPGLVTQDLNAGLTPADLVTALLGPGVSVSNISYTGANVAGGTFSGGTGIIGFESGIMLSSGDISFAPGPNTQDDVTSDNLQPGDVDLDGLIPGFTTFDACVLEFDFECSGTQIIQFQYVFTSDEYNEWVNSPYNDVFGFFLNGANIALVPGGAGTPVSINNVNCDNPYNPPNGSFCNLYVNNSCADIPPGTFPCAGVRDIQMDGLTVVLTATGVVNPGVNHIKLAVADAGDEILDSNVFIQGQSFVCGVPTGACCNMTALTCTNNVSQANCQGADEVWSVGLACSQLNPPCVPVIHPGGTNCSNPIQINAIPFVDVNTTADKDNDYANTCLDTFDNGDDIVYELTIGSTQCIDITVTGATPDNNWIGVVIDDVCPPSTACIAQTTTPDSVATISNLTLSPGTYYLMIDRWPLADDSLDFTLSITNCGEVTGACCDTGTTSCTNNVPLSACQGPNDVWSLGLACSQINPPCSPVSQDGQDCEFPLAIPAIPYTDLNTTCGRNDDYANTCLDAYDKGQDIIYTFSVSGPRCIDIVVTGATASDTGFGIVVDNACPPGLTCLAHDIATGSTAIINDLALTSGTYYLMLDNADNVSDCFSYALDITDCQTTIGACCLDGGQCTQMSQAACQQSAGLDWTPNTPCSPSPCPLQKGDANCDHAVNAADTPDFVAALIGGYTGCDISLADMDDSGVVDGVDIQLFVDALIGA
ncbi:MAG: choice-of-anchor L domain-containing protein [Phycisphaerales bacterium]|nr:choice-of-anchor L domain-containing protein [Phycisphaerales bacterium]